MMICTQAAKQFWKGQYLHPKRICGLGSWTSMMRWGASKRGYVKFLSALGIVPVNWAWSIFHISSTETPINWCSASRRGAVTG